MASAFELISFTLSIISIIALFFIYHYVRRTLHFLDRKISDTKLDSKLTDIFSHQVHQEDIHKLANELFARVKKQYALRSKSYSEAVQELKIAPKIGQKIRESLIDFFESMIMISYREESISEEDRDEIKRKLRLIIKMLPS